MSKIGVHGPYTDNVVEKRNFPVELEGTHVAHEDGKNHSKPNSPEHHIRVHFLLHEPSPHELWEPGGKESRPIRSNQLEKLRAHNLDRHKGDTDDQEYGSDARRQCICPEGMSIKRPGHLCVENENR